MTNFSFTHLLEAQQAASTGGMLLNFLPFLLLIPIFYFLMYRPQKKQERETAQMRNNLIIGDEIVTIGGIMGRLVAIKDDEDAIIIETGSDRVKMKFKKWCISTVDTVKEAPAKEKSSEKEEKTEKKGLFGKKKKDEEDK